MNNTWIFSAAAGTYTSPFWGVYNYFSNQINFEFFNDAACTQPSTNQQGNFTIVARGSGNAIFQAIPSGAINVAVPISLNWNGVANQLQVQISSALQNTNFVRIIFIRG